MLRPDAKRLLRAGCAGLLLAVAPCAFAAPPADAAAWMGVKGATAELIGERVFDGSVMLYRAGKRGGEPVLLVHGLGANGARDWSKVVPALAPAYDVYALDLPGFGRSDKGNQLYSPENLARVIEEAVAPRVGKPFALVGHSMGAAISLAYAAAYPQRVRRLVLVDLAGVLHGSVYAPSLVRAGLGQLGGNFPADAPWVDSLMRGLITKIEDMRTGQLAHALIAGSRLEVVAGAAHTPQLEDPDRFNTLLLEELAGGRKPPHLPPRTGPIEGKALTCDNQAGARFSGDIPKLTLIHCTGVEINHARIGELRVLESDVQVWNSEIRGGLYALRSRVPVAANLGALPLNLRLSVAEVRRPGAAPRYFHDSVRIGAGKSW